MKKLIWTDKLTKKLWQYYSRNPKYYFSYKYRNEIIATFKRFMKDSKTILDYGAGKGALTEKLLSIGKNVACVEFDSKKIVELNRKFGKYRNFLGAYTIDKLIKQQMKFDAIFLIEVIEHLSNKYLNDTFRDIKKIINPNNKIIITTPNDEDLNEQMVYCPVTDFVFHKYQHVRSWNRDSLEKYLNRTGINIVYLSTKDFHLKRLRKILTKVKNFIKLYILFRKDLLYKYPQLICVGRYTNKK